MMMWKYSGQGTKALPPPRTELPRDVHDFCTMLVDDDWAGDPHQKMMIARGVILLLTNFASC